MVSVIEKGLFELAAVTQIFYAWKGNKQRGGKRSKLQKGTDYFKATSKIKFTILDHFCLISRRVKKFCCFRLKMQ